MSKTVFELWAEFLKESGDADDESAEIDTAAQNRLMQIYEEGQLGGENDFERSILWYQSTAKEEDIVSQNNAEQDDERTFAFFQKIAKQGDAEAQYELGMMYEKGRGVTQDFVLAYAWFNLAAEQGHEDAKTARGNLADTKMSRKMIKKAQQFSRTLLTC